MPAAVKTNDSPSDLATSKNHDPHDWVDRP